jgi:hypothetical protein
LNGFRRVHNKIPPKEYERRIMPKGVAAWARKNIKIKKYK